MISSGTSSRVVLLLVILLSGLAAAQESSPRQSLDDAWWTGPMLAPSPATLPRGHFLVEPYLFDVSTQGRFDSGGVKRSTRHANTFGSLTYILYGLKEGITVGMIPTAFYGMSTGAPSSAGPAMGDLTLNFQYRLTKYHAESWIPMTAVVLQQTLPTGKYDRLTRGNDGAGAGAHTTTIAFYSQKYFWMPNGRILRMRFDISQAFSQDVKVQDTSVYGTGEGFRGRATPGRSLFIDNAYEYSMTKHWVLALDLTYRQDGNTTVIGYNSLVPQGPIQLDSGSSRALGLAPAVEYNFNSRVGVLVGMRIIPAGRNTAATLTPAIAVNIVR